MVNDYGCLLVILLGLDVVVGKVGGGVLVLLVFFIDCLGVIVVWKVMVDDGIMFVDWLM